MLALALALAAAPAATLPARPHAQASTHDEPMTIDGVLDEPAWNEAERHPIAHQKSPHWGVPPVQHAWFAIVADRDSIHIAVRCGRGKNIPIVARRTRRDRAIETDRITIDIDSRGLAIDAFHFEVTAGGSIVDGIRYNDTKIDTQWDTVWSAAVRQDGAGWTAEVEIPFAALRRPTGSDDPIGLQVRRYTNAIGEIDEWAPTPRDGSREVSRYGWLDGIKMPEPRLAFGVLPYTSLGVQLERGTGHPPRLVRRFGGDVKLRVGHDLTIDATALPDFGNVEADTAVVNLTTLEVRFPEKRPFFLEGVDVLETPLQLFYSRRIGSLSGTTAGVTQQSNSPARVLAAAKLLARAGERWSFAALTAVTEAQAPVVRDDALAIAAPQRVLPTTVYGLLRARIGLRNSGFVAATAATRTGVDSGPLPPWSTCPSGDAAVHRRCFADVHVLSADARLRDRSGMYVGTAQLLGTYRWGGPTQVGFDGNALASGDTGGAASVVLEKTGGRLIGDATYQWFGRDADWNAMGFLPQPNRHAARVDLGFQTLTPHGPVLEDRWQLEVFERFTLDGLPNGSGYQFNHRARWRTMWNHFVELHWRPSYWDIRETRAGTPFQRAGLLGLEVELTSDTRKKVIADVDVDVQARKYGIRVDGRIDVDFAPVDAVQLRLGGTTVFDHGEPRWTGSDSEARLFRFARLYADAIGVLARLNVTLARTLELQAYAQVLGIQTRWTNASSASFDDSRIVLRELSRAVVPAPAGEREAVVVANLFFRWEYRPGSNLWLVVTRNPIDTVFGDARSGIDLHRALALPASWLAMVKLTLWLDMERPLRKRVRDPRPSRRRR